MNSTNAAAVEELRWKKFPVLDDGFVCLVDAMGSDSDICQAARVSYNKDVRNGDTTVGDSDRNLIRYLMRHRHTTPTEMAEIKLLIRIPMDAWRQFVRHRTASINEYSTRYTVAIDARQETDPGEWRLQATNNKQGSSGMLADWPAGWYVYEGLSLDDSEGGWWAEFGSHSYFMPYDGPKAIRSSERPTPGDMLSSMERTNHAASQGTYDFRLALGVAREQARKDLPLSTYTEAYWKCDLHNVLHYLGLRMDSHAQKEIRDYATIIGEQIVAKLFPETWAAFLDYRVNALSLTALDIQVASEAVAFNMSPDHDRLYSPPHDDWDGWPEDWRGKARCRERDECIAKLKRLGIFR